MGINHRLIFVIMPFKETFDNIYKDLIEPATLLVNETLSIVEEDLKYFSYRTKDDLRTTSGWINIMEHLFSAQIVLGVLTDDNPNVFYELGIAHATQPLMRQVLIANKDYKPRFDIKDLIYYEYDLSDLSKCVEPLSTRLINALQNYKIEQEKIIKQARMKIGPNDFEIMMKHGTKSHFAIHSADLAWREDYEKEFGLGAHSRHCEGITNLCANSLLGLNTLSKSIDGGVNVEFSYWWTSMGNDVLYLMGLINDDELKRRRSQLPVFFEK
jgi:hypothetical protein